MSWWNSSWKTLEPETIIVIRRNVPVTSGWMTYYDCGCEESNKDGESYLHLCDFHLGFEEGVCAVRVMGHK